MTEDPWPPDRDPLRKLAIVGVVVVALVCTGFGVYAWRTRPAPPEAPRPTEAADPYASTPARDYPTGAAGIVLPEARATGPFSAVEVGDVLILVRAALIAGRLDSRMVVQGDPVDFLALLAPGERTRVQTEFTEGRFGAYATQIAPGHRLASAEPRVSGSVTYRLATGTLVPAIDVVTNFVWVYGFDTQRVVVVHDEVTWRVHETERVFPDQRGLWLVNSHAYMSNVDCTLAARALLAPAAAPVVHPSGDPDPDTLYDPNRSLDVGQTC